MQWREKKHLRDTRKHWDGVWHLDLGLSGVGMCNETRWMAEYPRSSEDIVGCEGEGVYRSSE